MSVLKAIINTQNRIHEDNLCDEKRCFNRIVHSYNTKIHTVSSTKKADFI